MSFTQTPQVETPSLDRLRAQGVSLDRHYVNLPICTPFRAILMTGRWPYQQGLMANHMSLGARVDLPDAEKTRGTISWAFREAGYTTGHFGKWHLAGRDARPFGFDKSVVWAGTNNHLHCRDRPARERLRMSAMGVSKSLVSSREGRRPWPRQMVIWRSSPP